MVALLRNICPCAQHVLCENCSPRWCWIWWSCRHSVHVMSTASLAAYRYLRLRKAQVKRADLDADQTSPLPLWCSARLLHLPTWFRRKSGLAESKEMYNVAAPLASNEMLWYDHRLGCRCLTFVFFVLSTEQIVVARKCVLRAVIWLPVGKSGYRSVTGDPDHPRETDLSDKKSRIFWNFWIFLNCNKNPL
jgi:hypothetical protein